MVWAEYTGENMKICEQLQGRTLVGKKRGTEWQVGELIGQHEGNTPGHFAVGYHVTSSDEHKAFMKTSAPSLTPRTGDLINRITTVANAHTFESSVLDHCNGNNKDRLITALDYVDEQEAVD